MHLTPKKTLSLGERLQQTDNRPSGFDYLRLALALLIIFFHTFEISDGAMSEHDVFISPWRAPAALLLPMFFALSGFLVAGSLERSRSIITFVGLRALRILPALAVEIVLSAFVLGTLCTQEPLHAYFSDPLFWSYFNNITGNIHYYLPGVFLHNPFPSKVNEQLWTIPFELDCYFILAIFALLGIFRFRVLLLVILTGYYIARFDIMHWNQDSCSWTVPGDILIYCFIAGVCLYRFRKKILFSNVLGILAGIISLFLLRNSILQGFSPFFTAYFTVYLGLFNPGRNKILLGGDYSYGLFLYGFSLQQSFAALGAFAQHWYLNFVVVTPFISGVAFLSWHYIEKPALGLRIYLKKLDESGYMDYRYWLKHYRRKA